VVCRFSVFYVSIEAENSHFGMSQSTARENTRPKLMRLACAPGRRKQARSMTAREAELHINQGLDTLVKGQLHSNV